MKKLQIILLTMLVLFSLCACGTSGSEQDTTKSSGETNQTQQVKDLNMESLYAAFEEKADLSEMEVWDDLEFFGIEQSDVKQAVLAVHGPGTKADEIWLIEAVDADAAKSIAQLAESHRKNQSEAYKKYDVAQYQVLEKAEIIQSGNYVALIVSAKAETLAQIFRQEAGL